MKKITKSILNVLVIILLFGIITYLVQTNMDFIKNFIGNGFTGMTIYFLIMVLESVVAPLSGLPLIPLASNLWGWKITSLLNISAWTFGAVTAFFISRKYGRPVVKKLISLEKIEKIEKRLPEKHVFLSIVLWRLFLPIDILSYALGLFSGIKFKTYLFATIIGIIPFAILMSYAGSLSLKEQIALLITGVIIAIIVLLSILVIYKIKRKNGK